MTRWGQFLGMAVVLGAAPLAAPAQEHEPGAARRGPPISDGWVPRTHEGTRNSPWLDGGAGTTRSGAPPVPRTIAPDWAGPSRADQGTTATDEYLDPWGEGGVFACGSTSVQYMAGGYWSGRPGPRVPAYNYLLASARHGWVVAPVEDRWIGRGAYEFVLDLSGALVTSGGYGDYFAGPTLYLRYNWVEPGSPLVPYQQFGVGAVYTDTYKDRTQAAVGQQWEFYTRWEIGVRYFVAPNLSLDVEAGIQHLSNAGHADRNLGVNAWGAQVGLTYYFPAGGK